MFYIEAVKNPISCKKDKPSPKMPENCHKCTVQNSFNCDITSGELRSVVNLQRDMTRLSNTSLRP